MVYTDHTGIKQLFQIYNDIPELAELQCRFDDITENNDTFDFSKLIVLYQQAIPLIERELWANELDLLQLNLYQKMFRQFEQMYTVEDDDERHSFIVVIPVADRPQHLNSCLESLLTLCENFNYGGFRNQAYSKIQVLIADDSKHENNIQIHRQIAEQTTQKGLNTVYFGQHEQKEQVNKISDEDRDELTSILGDVDFSAFYHKGASIMRNITYLKLNEIRQNKERLLFYFIDSDQEFKVKAQSGLSEQDVCAINYFYHLDQIFRNNNISVLTGKVVGDPPVSPAVMAGNFLEDVIAFLQQITDMNAQGSCQFHNHNRKKIDDASYHDMADLFGFNSTTASYQYHCSIEGAHNHIQCFSDFANKLSHFFYGEHPTRKSYYEHEELYDSIRPARTVYTGNYIILPKALSYFIPFAPLKLRMAGPVLGRIIKSEVADHFISANLPMLHKRTVDDIGQSEFRSGVKQRHSVIDLSGEFERQFFGDVMLFTIEKLTESGYPQKNIADETINGCLFDIEQSLHQKYEVKHRQIIDKLDRLKIIYSDMTNWWNKHSELEIANECFSDFISNIEYNFGEYSKAYERVTQPSNREVRNQQILAAIKTYAKDRSNWNKWVLMTDE